MKKILQILFFSLVSFFILGNNNCITLLSKITHQKFHTNHCTKISNDDVDDDDENDDSKCEKEEFSLKFYEVNFQLFSFSKNISTKSQQEFFLENVVLKTNQYASIPLPPPNI